MSYTFTKLSEVPTTESLNSEDMVLVEQDGEIKRVSKEMFNTGNASGGAGVVTYVLSGGNPWYAVDLEDNEISNEDVVKSYLQGTVKFFSEAGASDMVGFWISEPGGLNSLIVQAIRPESTSIAEYNFQYVDMSLI